MSRAMDAPSRMAFVVAALVAMALRGPRLVLSLGAAAIACSIWFSYAKLEYHTQRNDLLSAEKECQKQWQKYLDAFGDDDDMIVVVKGTDRKRMQAAADDVAAELQKRSDLFDRVFHKVDLRPLHPRSLLYLSQDDLAAIDKRLDGMSPLLGRFGDVSWQALSLQALLAQATVAAEGKQAGRALSKADNDLLAQLPAILQQASVSLQNPGDYRNPWAVGGRRDEGRTLTEPQYFFTHDGALSLVLARPKKALKSFTPAKVACEAARAIIADVHRKYPGLTFGLTGLPVLETDEMVASDEDSTFVSWFALIGVALLYLVVYRGFRYPLLTVGTLLAGTAWALGWATLTVGHLNILSSTFAVMIIGMGDYGVLWVARYDEERRTGRSPHDAAMETARHAGPSIVTAAATTSLAFFATMVADFKAVAELGWIAGFGVLFCALACITLLPACIVLLERRSAKLHIKNDPNILAFPAAGRPFFPYLSSRPRWVLGIGIGIALLCAGFAGRVTYDSNLLNMQADGLDSVNWERELIEHAAGATWDALSIAKSREEAIALRAKYEALPGVGRVVDAVVLVPSDQDQKLITLATIQAKLSRLPSMLPEPMATDPSSLQRMLDRYGQLQPAAIPATIRTALTQPTADVRIKEFDRRLKADLLADLRLLKEVSQPKPIAAHELPAEFRERYIGKNGEYLVRAFAKESLWDFPALERYTDAAKTVDPEATGKSYRTLEGLRQMKNGFERAGLFAIIVIVIVLWLDLRGLRPLLCGLFPLVIGIVATLGVMGFAGIPLNPANLIALPLIVGVGVDNGVHVLHDYAEKAPGKLYRLGSATGRGIAVAGLTTILGFGTLILARHRGMASLGLALTLGVTFCMIAALVLLPALLRWFDERKLRAPENAKPADSRVRITAS